MINLPSFVVSAIASLDMKRIIRLLLAAILAGVLTAWWLYLADIPWLGEKLFESCAWPFITIGKCFNGGDPQLGFEGCMFSMFLFLFIIIYTSLIVWRKIAKKRKDHDANA